MAKKIAEFIGVFDNISTFKDGNTKLRFETPASELPQVVQIITGLNKVMKLMVVTEDKKNEFEVPCTFYSMKIYSEGNAKPEFLVEPQNMEVTTSEIFKFVEKNANIKLTREE